MPADPEHAGSGMIGFLQAARNILRVTDLALAFPLGLRPRVTVVGGSLPASRYPPVGSLTGSNPRAWPDLVVTGEVVHIPYRIYNPEPPAEVVGGMDPTSLTILACLYTRHHDGHTRQRWLRRLLPDSAASWAVPFVVQLCGEYVVEICADIEEFLDALPEDSEILRSYRGFALANPSFLDLTERRADSYWSCYYRREHPQRTTYPGLKSLARVRRHVPGRSLILKVRPAQPTRPRDAPTAADAGVARLSRCARPARR